MGINKERGGGKQFSQIEEQSENKSFISDFQSRKNKKMSNPQCNEWMQSNGSRKQTYVIKKTL